MSEMIEFDGTILDLRKLVGDLIGLEITTCVYGKRRDRTVRFIDTVLVGHVNADDGGSCGCCGSYRDDTKVLRYRRVYDPNLTPRSEETDLGPAS